MRIFDYNRVIADLNVSCRCSWLDQREFHRDAGGRASKAPPYSHYLGGKVVSAGYQAVAHSQTIRWRSWM